MILVFLGSMRATVAVFFSIPLSALATFIALSLGGGSINSMVLGGLALAFSRLIDNSVVVLENIYRHLELGEPPEVAAEKGGREVALPVLAATLTTVVVFFPVTFLYGVSQFLFSALALAVVLSLFASYRGGDDGGAAVLRAVHQSASHHGTPSTKSRSRWSQARHNRWRSASASTSGSTTGSSRSCAATTGWWRSRCGTPGSRWRLCGVAFAASLALFPRLGLSFFPRTDAGQFVINLKAPSGTRARGHRKRSRQGGGADPAVVIPEDLGMIVSNIGVDARFFRRSTPAIRRMHTAFVQVSLKDGPQGRQLRIHGAREAAHRRRSCRS